MNACYCNNHAKCNLQNHFMSRSISSSTTLYSDIICSLDVTMVGLDVTINFKQIMNST